MSTRPGIRLAGLLTILIVVTAGLSSPARAATGKEIDARVDAALARFDKQVDGGKALLQRARGVLVFPGVIKAGFGIGGEYGEGALRIHGHTAGYYSIAAGSIGFQLGVQKKDIILVFLERKALERFRKSSGWDVGVDGSVTLIKLGASGSVDARKLNQPIVGFVIGQQGLMYNLTLEGSKITPIKR
ncbi:MAG TPA: YSC84-related protein [Gammaproteobacteria bacterium]|nr:YSC84-related protein [Gammaproteobacteria bacterium]